MEEEERLKIQGARQKRGGVSEIVYGPGSDGRGGRAAGEDGTKDEARAATSEQTEEEVARLLQDLLISNQQVRTSEPSPETLP